MNVYLYILFLWNEIRFKHTKKKATLGYSYKKGQNRVIWQGYPKRKEKKRAVGIIGASVLIPLVLPRIDGLRSTYNSTISGNWIRIRCLTEFIWQRPPMQTRLPVSLFENLQYFLNNNLAPFRWQMDSISATNKVKKKEKRYCNAKAAMERVILKLCRMACLW